MREKAQFGCDLSPRPYQSNALPLHYRLFHGNGMDLGHASQIGLIGVTHAGCMTEGFDMVMIFLTLPYMNLYNFRNQLGIV